MKKDIEKIIERISAFEDTPELCRWIENYREEIGVGGEVAETRYYLEEIRQNLEGMNQILQEIRKDYRYGEKQQSIQPDL